VVVDVGALAGWLAALGTIGSVIAGVIKFLQKINQIDTKLDSIKKEQHYIAKGTLASLKGLKEKGCNGPVTEALDELEDHILEQAHK
jgi:K+-transporting ATPase A subunit